MFFSLFCIVLLKWFLWMKEYRVFFIFIVRVCFCCFKVLYAWLIFVEYIFACVWFSCFKSLFLCLKVFVYDKCSGYFITLNFRIYFRDVYVCVFDFRVFFILSVSLLLEGIMYANFSGYIFGMCLIFFLLSLYCCVYLIFGVQFLFLYCC